MPESGHQEREVFLAWDVEVGVDEELLAFLLFIFARKLLWRLTGLRLSIGVISKGRDFYLLNLLLLLFLRLWCLFYLILL